MCTCKTITCGNDEELGSSFISYILLYHGHFTLELDALDPWYTNYVIGQEAGR